MTSYHAQHRANMRAAASTAEREKAASPSRQSCVATVLRLGLSVGFFSIPLGVAPFSNVMADDFQGIGFLPGGTFSQGFAVSGDGLVVVGQADGGGPTLATRWDAGSGIQSLGMLPGGTHSYSEAVSADGSVVVGGADSTSFSSGEAFRWTSGTGMQGLGTISGGTYSFALGVSGDGSVVVGYSGDGSVGDAGRAFRWTSGTGMESLGTLNGGSYSYADSISADGTTIAGYAADGSAGGANRAFRWTSGGGMQSLGVLTGGTYSQAAAVSADGAVVVGTGDSTAVPFGEAFRWDSGGMQGLGLLTGGSYSFANGVSADGTVVVGGGDSTSAGGSEAFRWTSGVGMESIRDLLVASGVDMTGWTTDSATGVSADGTVIVGTGINPSSQTEAWIARFLPGGSGLITVDEAARSFAGNGMMGKTGNAYIGSSLDLMMLIALHDLDRRVNRDTPYLVFAYGGYDSDPLGSGTLGLAREFENDVVVGVTLAAAHIRSDMIYDGNAQMNGGALGAFVTHSRQPGLQWTVAASAAALKGSVERAYLNGSGLDHSSGDTRAFGYGATGRVGYAFDVIEAARLTPFVSYTVSTIRYDGWTESGGAFPAQFDAFRDTAQTSRIGAEARYAFTPGEWIWGTAAWGHKLDGGDTANISGRLIGLFDLTVPGAAVAEDWTELTGGIHLPFGTGGALTASVTSTVPGGNYPTTWQGRVGISQTF